MVLHRPVELAPFLGTYQSAGNSRERGKHVPAPEITSVDSTIFLNGLRLCFVAPFVPDSPRSNGKLLQIYYSDIPLPISGPEAQGVADGQFPTGVCLSLECHEELSQSGRPPASVVDFISLIRLYVQFTEISLVLIEQATDPRSAAIIDVGGESTLGDTRTSPSLISRKPQCLSWCPRGKLACLATGPWPEWARKIIDVQQEWI